MVAIIPRDGILGGLAGGLLGGGNDNNNGARATDDGGLLGGILPTALPTLSLPGLPTDTTSSTTPSTPLSATSTQTSSVTTSTSLPLSSSSLSASASASFLPFTPTLSSITPSATPPPASTSTYASTDSGGSVVVITTVVPASVSVSTSALPSNTAAAVPFLQNKPLAAGVFSVVGIVAAIILAAILTVFFRRVYRKRQDREAELAAEVPERFGVDDDEYSTGHDSHTGGAPLHAAYSNPYPTYTSGPQMQQLRPAPAPVPPHLGFVQPPQSQSTGAPYYDSRPMPTASRHARGPSADAPLVNPYDTEPVGHPGDGRNATQGAYRDEFDYPMSRGQ